MTLSLKNIILAVLAVVLGSWAVYLMSQNAFGALVIDQGASANRFATYEFFASTSPIAGLVSSTIIATTTTATSTNITSFYDATYGRLVDGSFDITGAKKVTLYFSRGGAVQPNTGATVYKIQTTKDGSVWNDFNQFVQSTSTSITSAVQPTATISAATSTVIYGMDLDYTGYKAIRCIVVETTDGEHSCAASAQF